MKTEKDIRECRTDGIPNEVIKKRQYDYEAYKAKYTSKHRSYTFNLDLEKDKKLIEYLDKQENRSGLIRKILREVVI